MVVKQSRMKNEDEWKVASKRAWNKLNACTDWVNKTNTHQQHWWTEKTMHAVQSSQLTTAQSKVLAMMVFIAELFRLFSKANHKSFHHSQRHLNRSFVDYVNLDNFSPSSRFYIHVTSSRLTVSVKSCSVHQVAFWGREMRCNVEWNFHFFSLFANFLSFLASAVCCSSHFVVVEIRNKLPSSSPRLVNVIHITVNWHSKLESFLWRKFHSCLFSWLAD